MPALRIVLMIVLLLMVGCKKEQADPAVSKEEKTAEPEASKQEATSSPHTLEGQRPEWSRPSVARKTLKGNYVLALVEQPVAIFHIDPEDKQSPVKLVNFNQQALQNEQFRNIPQIKSVRMIGSKVTDKNVQLEFSTGPLAWDFEGQIDPMLMKGNVLVAGSKVVPGQLFATDANQVKQEWQPLELHERDALQRAAEPLQKGQIDPLKKFINEHPNSGMTVAYAFPLLMRYPGLTEIPDAELKALGTQYVEASRKWGQRAEGMANLEWASVCLRSPKLLDEAGARLANAEKLLTGRSEKAFGPTVQFLKTRLDFDRNLAKIRTGSDADKTAAVEKLKEMRKKSENRWNPQILGALATYAEEKGNLDEAIALYTTAVALPGMERYVAAAQMQGRDEDQEPVIPSDSLKQIWKKKHGNDAGLKKHLADAYDRELASFDGPKHPARKAEEGNRVVLVELFTGSECPPCVGADLALGSIERSYSNRDVVILRYHQHIPGPDPLTSPDSEARFGYYSLQGTPAVILNGRPVANAGGYAFHVPSVIENMEKALAVLLKQNTEVSIDLNATQSKDEVKISANVKGIPKDSDDLRLRVVLAEDELEYEAGNGVRKHEMVVRQMPTGPIGIRPENDKLTFSKTVKLSEIKQRLTDYLAALEERSEQKFRARPLALEKLSVIAFVQNERTREVLQTRMIRLSEPASGGATPAQPSASSKSPMPMAAGTANASESTKSTVDDSGAIEAPKP